MRAAGLAASGQFFNFLEGVLLEIWGATRMPNANIDDNRVLAQQHRHAVIRFIVSAFGASGP